MVELRQCLLQVGNGSLDVLGGRGHHLVHQWQQLQTNAVAQCGIGVEVGGVGDKWLMAASKVGLDVGA